MFDGVVRGGGCPRRGRRARAFDADAVIGLGGGSSLDVAKLVRCSSRAAKPSPRSTASASPRGRACRCCCDHRRHGFQVTPISIVTTGARKKASCPSPPGRRAPRSRPHAWPAPRSPPPRASTPWCTRSSLPSADRTTNPMSRVLACEGLAPHRTQYPPGGASRLGPRRTLGDASGLDARRPGAMRGRRRACPRLSDRRPFRRAARALERARAAARAALQRERLRGILCGPGAARLSGADPRERRRLHRGRDGARRGPPPAAAPARCRHRRMRCR